jgi:hypothetical protein
MTAHLPLSAIRHGFRSRMYEYRGNEHRLTVANRKGMVAGTVAQLRYEAHWAPPAAVPDVTARQMRDRAIAYAIAAQDAMLGGRFEDAEHLGREAARLRALAAARDAVLHLARAA